MADVRIWGVENAPGVQVGERLFSNVAVGQKLGIAVMVGMCERGKTDELNYCPNRKLYDAKCGGLFTASELPDAARGFFEEAKGAGELYVYRITDGTDVKATIKIKDRLATPEDKMQIDALSSGRWAGRKDGDSNTASTAITATTLEDTTKTWLINQWAGAELTSTAHSGESWTVVSNTVDTLQLQADADISGWLITEPYAVDLAPNGGIAVEITEGKKDRVLEFGVRIYLDGKLVLRYDDLSLDNSASNYWESVINQDPNNYYVEVTDLKTGESEIEANKPANNYSEAGTNTYNLTDPVVNQMTDTFTWIVNEFAGGYLYPNRIDAGDRYKKFRIISNTATVITVEGDMADANVADGDTYMIEYPEYLESGYDGNTPSAAQYSAAFEISNSLINTLKNKEGVGFVKICVPGVETASVLKDMLTYCEDKNYQGYVAIPDATAIIDVPNYVANTLNRSDFGVAYFPSNMYITDNATGLEKLITSVGDVLGIAARIANNFDGYHKAPAGLMAKLTRAVKLPVNLKDEDVEILNPAGINAIYTKHGNYTVWGDRTISANEQFKWLHQRAQLSYYEWLLMKNFDDIIFAINDKDTWDLVAARITSYFRKEWRPKRALNGENFDDCFYIKIDEENNPPSSQALGELNVELGLRLADTVEIIKILINQMGVAEELA